MNLHSIVRGAIASVHPDETVNLLQSIGQKNVRGRIIPQYAPLRTVRAQFQPLGQNDLAQAEQTSNTKVDRKAYLYADNSLPPQGIVRPIARNGDFIQRQDGSWWLVSAMIEDFSDVGWVSVGITLQVEPPDLSGLEADDTENDGKNGE